MGIFFLHGTLELNLYIIYYNIRNIIRKAMKIHTFKERKLKLRFIKWLTQDHRAVSRNGRTGVISWMPHFVCFWVRGTLILHCLGSFKRKWESFASLGQQSHPLQPCVLLPTEVVFWCGEKGIGCKSHSVKGCTLLATSLWSWVKCISSWGLHIISKWLCHED